MEKQEEFKEVYNQLNESNKQILQLVANAIVVTKKEKNK